MTDRLSQLQLAMDLGFQLGQGKKVDLGELADKHLTKECPDCGGHGVVGDTESYVGITVVGDCERCKGTGRVPLEATDE